MNNKEVRWERMFPDDLERAFNECPLVYFPYGLCEPHGPHCALELDGLEAYVNADRVARAGGGTRTACGPCLREAKSEPQDFAEMETL